ncbi:MAG: hypothetical protein WA902_02385 [Thermosynechococcaceae cyanobacterium]
MPDIIWSDYLKYRAELRGFELTDIEEILRYTGERYYDTETGRLIAAGSHRNCLVIIPYELTVNNAMIPVTIHATTRQQIKFRLKSGRYTINGST